ncbi:MAG: hypothetical protein JKY96_03400, partial [Phycisphaerales bacterium]|nr:hypothetical protein [Phycisphaerales bacterium]
MKKILIALLFLVCAPVSLAQLDGYTYPEEHEVSESTGTVVNPFGDPKLPTMDTDAKVAFSKAVDLSVLNDLAVFHNGRVKILGTLGNETVMNLTGRHKHFDILNKGTGDIAKMKKASFDPMFTMLDVQIDPMHYLDRPLLGINYLPLRRAILRLAEADAVKEGKPFNTKGWLKTGMISPRMYNQYASIAFNKHDDSPPFRKAVGRLDRSYAVFANGLSNLLVIAPKQENDPW